MVEYPENSWEQLSEQNSEVNVTCVEINDSHHAFTMLCKTRQVKNEYVQVYGDRLYALANDAFAEVDKW